MSCVKFISKYAVGQNGTFEKDADWLTVTKATETCHDVRGLTEETDYRFRVALFVRTEEFEYEQLDLSSQTRASLITGCYARTCTISDYNMGYTIA